MVKDERNLALDRLNGIDDDGDGARIELLEGFLGVDIDGGEPAAEARVGMVPANDHFRPTRLLEGIEHGRLEDMVDGLDRDRRA